MKENQLLIKKILGTLLLLFPSILVLSFIMHMHSDSNFFYFKLKASPYNSDELFESLIKTGGNGFVHAHALTYISVPLMILTILCLGYLLYSKRPLVSFVGVTLGIVGAIFMSGFLASWLSFSAISRVNPQDYIGAKAALAELTKMTGVLQVITRLSFLTFVGLIILCLGFLTTKLVPKWSPLLIILGCIIISLFWSLVNWMFLGSILILIGLYPISKLFKQEYELKTN